MRHLLAFVLIIALVGSAAAADLGTTQKIAKSNTHVGMNPGTPDGREGGEDMASAVPIYALPFNDTGNTFDNVDDYDAVCPYSGSTSPDVVYSFTPAADMAVKVDLCGSGYDTKTYVMDGAFNLIDCNDDAYFDDTCGVYVSMIEAAALTAGTEYFIIVDGYGGDAGDYVLEVTEVIPPEPCVLVCDGVAEGEPELVDEYVDAYNGGCNSPDYGNPFQALEADEFGELVFCGKSGWYMAGGGNSRDTDWFTAVVGPDGMVEWTLDAEQETYGFLLGPNDCGSVGVVDSFIAGPCMPATYVIQGNPGDIVWLWVGPTEFAGPAGFVGHEYNYTCNFVGLDPGIVATDNVSFDSVKSLYR